MLKVNPQQASALAVFAQAYTAGASSSELSKIEDELKGDALKIAHVFVGKKTRGASKEVLSAATELKDWVQSLRHTQHPD